MGNSFFDPGPDRATKVHHLFSTIAPRYDLINDLQSFGLHRVWKRKLVQLAALKPGSRTLDVCCGTGDITQLLAQAGGVQTVGLDFSRPMLARAQQRAQSSTRISWVEADALALPFPNRQFDCITIGYGLRNVARIDRTIRQFHRTLKPGGQLLILEFGKPARPIWRTVYYAYLQGVVPLFGRLFYGNREPYAYIFESLQSYPDPADLAKKLETTGFSVALHPLLGGIMTIHQARKTAAS